MRFNKLHKAFDISNACTERLAELLLLTRMVPVSILCPEEKLRFLVVFLSPPGQIQR
jgi:hypothetical protein